MEVIYTHDQIFDLAKTAAAGRLLGQDPISTMDLAQQLVAEIADIQAEIGGGSVSVLIMAASRLFAYAIEEKAVECERLMSMDHGTKQ